MSLRMSVMQVFMLHYVCSVTFVVTAHVGDAVIVLYPYTNFEICRPSRSEGMADFRSRP